MDYVLANIREMLIAQGYSQSIIITNQVIMQTSNNSSLQNAIFLIEESSQPILSNNSFLDFALYLRNSDPQTAETQILDIYHYLHGKRGNVGTVANNKVKINLVQALSRPYVYSLNTTGANLVEYVIKFRVQYIDTDFDNI